MCSSDLAEDVLNGLRRREIQVTQRAMDALLATRDQLGQMLADIRSGGLKQHYAIDDLLSELERVQAGETSPAVVGPSSAAPDPGQGVANEKNHEAALASVAEPSQSSSQKTTITDAHPLTAQTMRVDVRNLDELINLIGELVLERNRLMQLAKEVSSDVHGQDSPLSHSAARLSFITEELQAAALRTRMVPIDTIFCKFPRLVRDLARSLNKEADLIIRGQDTEIDKTMVELVSDPLVHLIRNSLDHGLELPEDRERAGKARKGTISLEAKQEGDRIIVSISDDGAGIDPQRILQKALEREWSQQNARRT